MVRTLPAELLELLELELGELAAEVVDGRAADEGGGPIPNWSPPIPNWPPKGSIGALLVTAAGAGADASGFPSTSMFESRVAGEAKGACVGGAPLALAGAAVIVGAAAGAAGAAAGAALVDESLR